MMNVFVIVIVFVFIIVQIMRVLKRYQIPYCKESRVEFYVFSKCLDDRDVNILLLLLLFFFFFCIHMVVGFVVYFCLHRVVVDVFVVVE